MTSSIHVRTHTHAPFRLFVYLFEQRLLKYDHNIPSEWENIWNNEIDLSNAGFYTFYSIRNKKKRKRTANGMYAFVCVYNTILYT